MTDDTPQRDTVLEVKTTVELTLHLDPIDDGNRVHKSIENLLNALEKVRYVDDITTDQIYTQERY